MHEESRKPLSRETLGVIPVIPEELDDFETQATRFRNGEIDNSEFLPYRLRRGVYGQRQADVQMVRVKIPFGGLSASQLEALGRVSRDYAPLGKGHVTTRENVQFHFVPLDEATDVLRLLGEVGLTTREACGNSVRNVTGCPYAGVCKDQVFDTTPYAGAFARYFVRKDFTQDLPRKFKVAFSSCSSDCVVGGIHDIGFIPLIKEVEGIPVHGFKMLVGGGLATFARTAEVLYKFVPVSDFLRVSEALIRVFDQAAELRKSRFKARIKFLVSWIGIDGLRERVEEELKKDWAKEPINPEPYLWKDDEEADAPPVLNTLNCVAANPNGDAADYYAWRNTNVTAQRQEGYFAVEIKLPLGNILTDQFFALADLTRRFARGRARTSFEQNLVLRWVREGELYPLWKELHRIGLAEKGAREISDVVSCPGTDSCKLGITSSMGLANAMRETLQEVDQDPLTREMHIKMSGCPNSCGQHHIANIGFHGGTLRANGAMLPAYEIFLGGQYDSTDGEIRIGKRIQVRIPAKRVPDALKKMLSHYQEYRSEGERFNEFLDRQGSASFEDLLQEFHLVGQFNDEPDSDLFIDWSQDKQYVLERGEGECLA